MTERAYTVAEIDALRRAIETRWLFGTSLPFSRIPAPIDSNGNPTFNNVGGIVSRQWMGSEKSEQVEALVRTHMLAGHTAQDIYDADRPKPPLEVTEEHREQGATDLQRAYPERRP